MGLFKQMKDMKTAINAAPEIVDQANKLAENAQVMQQQAMAQQASVAQQAATYAAAANGSLPAQGGNLEPIAGVSIELYAEIVKAIAPHNYDQSLLPGIAESKGIDAASWQRAHDGWNARIQSDPAVGAKFGQIYREV